jgi:chorismate mutase
MKALEMWREKIDEVDEALVELLNTRAGIAVEIGKAKLEFGAEVQDPAREDEVLNRISSFNAGPLSDEAIRAIYRRIISGCVEVQSSDRPADNEDET